MKIYKIRVTGEVLETAAATRRCIVDGLVLTFGREPLYVRAFELPAELATDPYLNIEAVESAPSGTPVIDLKSERVEEPTSDLASAASVLPDDDTDLKSERVQKPAAAAAPAAPEPVLAAPSGKKRG
jgi:hypothetical protein